ncbi:MAG: zinc ribbon domain-containing protein [Acidobacteria bacterium]|nr:zinc ribbon domain-containing protein [Acidobacteriota bacterium]
MFCPSCGSEQTQGLRYCNRCGANLAPASERSTSKLIGMVWAVSLATALISLGGLFLIFIFAIEISGHGNSHTSSIVFLIIALLVLLVIVALMIRLLSRLVNAHLQSRATAPTPLSEQPTAQLPEARESVPVSDEQTTRRFEPAPGERK